MRILCPECEATLNIRNVSAGRELECPKCGTSFLTPDLDDEDEDQDEAPRKKKNAADPDGKDMPVAKIVTTAVAAVVAAAAVIWVFGGFEPSKPKETAKTETKEEATQVLDPKIGGALRPNAQTTPAPAEVAALFRANAEAAPAAPLPLLTPPAVPGGGDMLTLTAGAPAKGPAGKGGDMSLDEVKKAVVYIRVEAGPVGGGTGSGFLVVSDGTTGLVATNHHVIAAAVPRAIELPGAPKGTVTVVFDGGLPSEVEYKAEIVGFDAEVDLAVLRITAPKGKLPKPLEPKFAAPPQETTRVRICGFPFGERFATSKKAPSITIGTGSVSSVRRDDAGKVSELQIDGALNPGNSGGPLVDEAGHLVGVAVKTIRGAGIGMAIPASELIALMDGRVMPPVFVPLEIESGEAVFEAIVPVADPLNKVASVGLHVWTGAGDPPAAAKDAAGRWKPVAGAKRYDLPAAKQGEAKLPLRLKAPAGGRPVVLQYEVKGADGAAAFSEPVTYTYSVGKAQSARDAMPVAAFQKNVAKYEGRTMVLKAKYVHPPQQRWDVTAVTIQGEGGEALPNLTFLADLPMAAELGALTPPPALGVLQLPPLNVRLTCVVGKARADGTTPVRITKLTLLFGFGRADRDGVTFPGGKLGGGGDE